MKNIILYSTGTILFSILTLSFMPVSLQFLKDTAFIKKLNRQAENFNQKMPDEKVYLHFDRPFYKPGDDIWYKVYLRDGITNQPSTVSQIIYVELLNPKGNIEKTLSLIAMNGSTKGDFHIDENAPGGMYKVKAYTNWMKNSGSDNFFEKDIQIQAVVLPRLLMNMEFDRKDYGKGDQVKAIVKLATLNNKPLANYNYSFKASLKGTEYSKGNGTTDNAGITNVTFNLPDTLNTGDGLLNVIISYNGMNESISRSIPITLNNINLQFFPEGGDLVAGLSCRVAFKALNEFGKPADIEGVLIDQHNKTMANFQSYHQGMGAFKFIPDLQNIYTVKITKPEGISMVYSLPKIQKSGYVLTVDSVERSQAKISILASVKSKVTLIGQVKGRIYYSEEIKLKAGKNSRNISLSNFPAGVAQFTVFDNQETPCCERLVFVNKHRQMNIEIKTDQEKYLPRQQVEMIIKTTDENGKAIPADLSLSVVDDKLLSFADDKSDNILSYLLVSSDLKGKVEEPNFYFKTDEPKADKALDYLLMTQGWRRFTWKEILNSKPDTIHKIAIIPAEKAIVKGSVVDQKGQPVFNAKVVVLETGDSTVTDIKGNFEFHNINLSLPKTLKAILENKFYGVVTVKNYTQENKITDEIVGIVKYKETNAPISGATIYIKNTTIGTTTDFYGNFRIKAQEATPILVFSYTGYNTQEIKFTGNNPLEVFMEYSDLQLDDVVVLAMGMEGGEPADKKMAIEDDGIAPAFSRDVLVEKTEAATEAVEMKVENQKEALNEEPQNKFTPPVVVDEVVEEKAMLATDEIVEAAENENVNAITMPNDQIESPEQEIFFIVEEMPEYPGGDMELRNFISEQVSYPEVARENNIQGKVYVRFAVTDQGKVANVSIARGVHPLLDEEAVNVVKSMPAWKPGKQRGKPVNVWYTVPINFQIVDNIPAVNNVPKNRLQFILASSKQGNENLYYRAREFYSPVYISTDKVETRSDFRASIYWNPDVSTGKNGETKVTFCNSDEITQFRAIAEGISTNGLVGRKEFTYFTQLPFSMNVKVPTYFTFNDKVSIPLTLTNNTENKIAGVLNVKAPENFKSLETLPYIQEIEAQSVKTIYLNYSVLNNAGKSVFKISYDYQGLTDAFEQPVEVLAKGFPMSASFSGQELDKTFSLNIEDPIEGSLTAQCMAFPNIVSNLVAGMESILQEPYDCFEQTSSSSYPNLLVLRYLNETGNADPAVVKRAKDLLDRGYKRLTSFETKQNGYEWFGQTPAHEALSAYGLLQFSDMKPIYASLDNSMVARTSTWLMSRRDGKGGFSQSSEALDSYGSASPDIANAYIVYALTEAGYTGIDREFKSVMNEVIKSNDPYKMALLVNALYSRKEFEKGDALMNALLKYQKPEGFWDGTSHSITYSTGQSLKIETTSLTILGMLKSKNVNNEALTKGIQYLVSSRSGYGGFGSTQSTILALKALTEYTKFSKRTQDAGTLEIYVDKNKVASKSYKAGEQGNITISGLSTYIKPGSQNIEIKFSGTQSPLPYSLVINWTARTPASSPECKVDLETSLKSEVIKVGETVRMSVNIKNKTDNGLPMTVALIGIPSGLSPQPWQLKELQEKKVVDFYEVSKYYVVFYYRCLVPKANHTIALDLKAEVPGQFEAPASSAYLYYTNEFKDWEGGEKIEIK